VSLQSALARVAELNAFGSPPPPPPAAPPAGADGAFANALQRAERAGGAPAAAASGQRGHYPHLSGDLDAAPALLRRLEALAAKRGEKFHITSGHRSYAEQKRLWDNRHNNPYPVAPPGKSRHNSGRAADVTIGGRPIQSVIPYRELVRAGLRPLRGDAVHVELP
jgi:D-alanyl-D-alanine carboxypeptidase